MAASFLERSSARLHRIAEEALYAETAARAPGPLQALDARAKIVGAAALIVAATAVHRLAIVLALLGVAVALAAIARLVAAPAMLRLWSVALLVTLLVGAPALALTPGPALARLPLGIAITTTGVRTVLLLLARVATTATLSLLLVLSTRWVDLLRGLRGLGAPVALVAVVAMTHRYLFVLLRAARDLFEGRRSRIVGPLRGAEARRLAGGAAGALLLRTMETGDQVYLAMQARGYRGEPRALAAPRLRAVDWLATLLLLTTAAAAVWIGR